ncbi:Nucleoside-diphosphate-sugar epimerase [Pseudomonas asplenii]|uniref:Nucleoside-diphosphate-sugar epimerase n=1 Tax=Pseudomonas asplenii TaxID=53407 RepID=A0A1H1U666_9PSED|nr:NAD(P)-dependent oxidoreductase [Pseudomonas asplenii]UZE28340.1 NAD(P)-dependent oxidoreductase [Pseudomonas asplenii]SDS67992.1 Nucleoside-diphosphate-sugar epimerase [Pseudomonas asplenii]
MSLNILVTGGAGYLGSTLVPALLAAGHKVTVLDNFLFKQASLNHVCHDPNFTVVKGDIRLESVMAPLLSKADVVIPLAALVGAPICNADPVGASSINHDAIKLMLRLMSPEQIVLMPTTNSAYGTGDADNFCNEDSPLRPISQYAKEKVEVEKHLMQRENAISFRLATVFGMSPRMRTDLLVNDFTYRAVYDRFVVLFESSFKRNYIHVRDVARVFQHGLENFSSMKGEVYNVGLSDANISKRELCERIQAHIPDFVFLEAPVGKDQDQRNYVVSNAKVEATGFRPIMSLDDGIRDLIKGFTMIKNSAYGNV